MWPDHSVVNRDNDHVMGKDYRGIQYAATVEEGDQTRATQTTLRAAGDG